MFYIDQLFAQDPPPPPPTLGSSKKKKKSKINKGGKRNSFTSSAGESNRFYQVFFFIHLPEWPPQLQLSYVYTQKGLYSLCAQCRYTQVIGGDAGSSNPPFALFTSYSRLSDSEGCFTTRTLFSWRFLLLAPSTTSWPLLAPICTAVRMRCLLSPSARHWGLPLSSADNYCHLHVAQCDKHLALTGFAGPRPRSGARGESQRVQHGGDKKKNKTPAS